MNGTIYRRAGARRDLVEAYRYYAREAGQSIANRFLAESEATFARLARTPGLGVRFESDQAGIDDL